ncbi:hypothetical protein FF011L_33030 [Roseimaritima multifibrata]|uniref:Uncharacterized protein n=1 Tax=Roseimaritima multifibrata TaxID=1930274 RepID=A0A517MI29_9BACT|nr:hypothetical protein [Roseimaritima multifibrata]QDS94524.1 hypothetical protein FF011L_33030 [Roseimaritima multifibrata]
MISTKQPATTGVTPSELASAMVAALQSDRGQTSIHFPSTLSKLASQIGWEGSRKAIVKASCLRIFTDNVIVARRQTWDAPLALIDHVSALAEDSETLLFALKYRSQNKTKAHTPAELASVLTNRLGGDLRKQFRQSLQQRIQSQSLPRTVGCIAGGQGRPRLFQLQDLQPQAWQLAILAAENNNPVEDRQKKNVQVETVAPSSDRFELLFDAAFQRLCQSQGGHNFVDLASLRTALPEFSCQSFDTELRRLRIARRYRLSGAENRNDISPAQRSAGISEAGSLLIYAQRVGS